MCGIAGLVDPSGAPVDREALQAMTRSLALRGPDGEATWFGAGVGLGHRRLAALTRPPGSSGPSANDDESVVVVLDGAINNALDLRTELSGCGHRFRSRGDAEVIARAYESWGDAFIERLDGAFAFALWDARRRRLLAARDRFGKKPLYHAQLARGGAPPLFAFASELKALRLLPGFDRALDPAALRRYLLFECVPPPRTIFRGARKLDAAERLSLEAGDAPAATPKIDRHFELPFPTDHPAARLDEATEMLQTLLRRAVERQLVAEGPVGVCLSGGLDSSTVTAVAADLLRGQPLPTVSLGFTDPSTDESPHARLVARHLGTEHHEERLSPAALLDALPTIDSFLDEPIADASIVPTYLLSRFARRHVAVALRGDGGDELFGRDPTFAVGRAARLVFERLPARVRGVVARAAALLPQTTSARLSFEGQQGLRGGKVSGPRRQQRWLAAFLPEEHERLLHPELRASADAPDDPLADVDPKAADLLEADRLMAFHLRLPLAAGALTNIDRAAGACGLDVRTPLLDTELVTFACLLPPHLRGGLLTKRLLKRAARGLVPDDVLARKTQGFAVPTARWLRGALAPALREALSPEALRRSGLFDPGYVTGLVDEHLAGRRDRHQQLWTLFAFERWRAAWA